MKNIYNIYNVDDANFLFLDCGKIFHDFKLIKIKEILYFSCLDGQINIEND